MPPNAPSGAAHMISRMTPKTIREATSKTPTIALRWPLGEHRDRRPRRGSPARGCAGSRSRRTARRSSSGSRSSVMKPTRPGRGVARLGDRLLGRLARAPRVGSAVEAAARREEVGRDQAERERDDRHREEVGERAQREPAGAREVAERRDADDDRDEDHRPGDRLDQLDEGLGEPFRLRGRSGRDEPERRCPRAIATITQNQSCV